MQKKFCKGFWLKFSSHSLFIRVLYTCLDCIRFKRSSRPNCLAVSLYMSKKNKAQTSRVCLPETKHLASPFRTGKSFPISVCWPNAWDMAMGEEWGQCEYFFSPPRDAKLLGESEGREVKPSNLHLNLTNTPGPPPPPPRPNPHSELLFRAWKMCLFVFSYKIQLWIFHSDRHKYAAKILYT